jgi:hypothetical protein
MKAWKHIRAILVLPVMATIVIPGTLMFFTGLDTLGLWERWPIIRFIVPVVGLLFVEPTHFITERKMLLGIKRRVEQGIDS